MLWLQVTWPLNDIFGTNNSFALLGCLPLSLNLVVRTRVASAALTTFNGRSVAIHSSMAIRHAIVNSALKLMHATSLAYK